MGDDPGKRLTHQESQTIMIKLTGPIKGSDAKQFRRELDALLKKFRPKAGGGLERPLKKARNR